MECMDAVGLAPRQPVNSRCRVSPMVLALATALACADNFADPDLWMHIKVGQLILNAWRIPAVDLYSYSATGLPWRNHEWLAQVLFAVAYAKLGIIGLKLLKLICAVVTVSAMASGLSRTAAPPWVQRVVLLAMSAGIAVQMQFRPHLFTFAMLSLVMATVANEAYRRRAQGWLLIPCFALWANLHGGFIVGLGALGIATLITGGQELYAIHWPAKSLRLAAVTIGCAAATLLNPHGIGLWGSVLHSISDPVIHLFVNDWVSLPANLLYQWDNGCLQIIPFLLPLMLFAGLISVLAITPREQDLVLVAIALVFVGAAFYCARNTDLAVIAVTIPLAHHWGLAVRTRGCSSSPGSRLGTDGEPLSPGLTVLGVADWHLTRTDSDPNPILLATSIMLLVLASGILSKRLRNWEQVPRGAIEFIKRNGLHGNILNNFDWGEYLVWHLVPDSRVFVDGRCELVYPDSVLAEYFKFFYGRPGGEQLLDKYPHDLVLVKIGTGAYRLISADPRWRKIYGDSISALFVRSDFVMSDHSVRLLPNDQT